MKYGFCRGSRPRETEIGKKEAGRGWEWEAKGCGEGGHEWAKCGVGRRRGWGWLVRYAQGKEMMKATLGDVRMSAIQRLLAHGPPRGIDKAGTRSREHTKAVRMSHLAVLTGALGDLYHHFSFVVRPTHYAHT